VETNNKPFAENSPLFLACFDAILNYTCLSHCFSMRLHCIKTILCPEGLLAMTQKRVEFVGGVKFCHIHAASARHWCYAKQRAAQTGS